MITKITTYQIRADKLAEIEAAVQAFVAAIAENEPRTWYAAYRTDEPYTYFHIMGFPDAEAESRHQKASYTLEFVEALYPNCEVQPRFTDLELIRSASSDS